MAIGEKLEFGSVNNNFDVSEERIVGRWVNIEKMLAGASIPIYRWRQMRHGHFLGDRTKSLILNFNIQQ